MILNIFFRVMLALCIVVAASGLVAVGMFTERIFGALLHEIVLVLLMSLGFWLGVMIVMLVPTVKIDFRVKPEEKKGERR